MSVIKSIIRENGFGWVVNRGLYSIKLKSLRIIPKTENFYEKKVRFPARLDIFNVNTEALKKFINALPDEKKDELIKLADDASEGRILGFSSIELDYGNPVDWQLNPLTGKRCNEKVKWYQIPDFDSERGDIKVTWEISRFSHFVTLARAYLLTENQKYYKAYCEQLSDWLQKNNYSFGANYKCGQECSLRMVNVLLAYSVFKGENLATEVDEDNLRKLVMCCYRKILSNFFYAYKCIKNNHTISELLGMIVGAWCCGEDVKLRKAYAMLDEVIDEQFFDDGGYRQYSFNYQRLALQDLECVIAVSRQTGLELSEKSKNKVLKSAWLFYQCQDESGDVPNYGSNDGTLVFPVTSCGYRDFRPVTVGIYGLLKQQKPYEAGIYDEEYLWFSGNDISELETVRLKRLSQQFSQAGLFIIRNNKSWLMAVLNQFQSRPAQMDQLHIDLWIDGINVLCDTGTYSYAGNAGKELRSASGHNSVVVTETEQMNSHGPFMIYDWTKRMKYSWVPDKFYGHMKSRNGYEHIRDVKKTDSGYEITDRVLSGDNRSYKILYHTPCGVQKKGSSIELVHNGRVLCEIECNRTVKIRKAVRSLFYMKADEINEIVVEGNGVESTITKIRMKYVRR